MYHLIYVDISVNLHLRKGWWGIEWGRGEDFTLKLGKSPQSLPVPDPPLTPENIYL